MHHAERIAIWVGQDNVVGTVRIAPVHPSGAESNQSFNLGGLVRRVEVEVVALMAFRVDDTFVIDICAPIPSRGTRMAQCSEGSRSGL